MCKGRRSTTGCAVGTYECRQQCTTMQQWSVCHAVARAVASTVAGMKTAWLTCSRSNNNMCGGGQQGPVCSTASSVGGTCRCSAGSSACPATRCKQRRQLTGSQACQQHPHTHPTSSANNMHGGTYTGQQRPHPHPASSADNIQAVIAYNVQAVRQVNNTTTHTQQAPLPTYSHSYSSHALPPTSGPQ